MNPSTFVIRIRYSTFRRSLKGTAENGEGGIRTHETQTGLPVFETGSFNRSDTSPGRSTV
jgi:hypothetical protein